MTTILAIDPGSVESGYVWVTTDPNAPGGLRIDPGPDEFTPAAGKVPNHELLSILRDGEWPDAVVIEWVSGYGRPVGAEVFETCLWAGRFVEATDGRAVRITRRDVAAHLCGAKAGATDATVWQALVDRFGGIGGKEAAVGRKATPGPLYGVHSDARAALALAVCYAEDPTLAIDGGTR